MRRKTSLAANLPEDDLAYSPLARWNNCCFYPTPLEHHQLGLQPALLLKLHSSSQTPLPATKQLGISLKNLKCC